MHGTKERSRRHILSKRTKMVASASALEVAVEDVGCLQLVLLLVDNQYAFDALKCE